MNVLKIFLLLFDVVLLFALLRTVASLYGYYEPYTQDEIVTFAVFGFVIASYCFVHMLLDKDFIQKT